MAMSFGSGGGFGRTGGARPVRGGGGLGWNPFTSTVWGRTPAQRGLRPPAPPRGYGPGSRSGPGGMATGTMPAGWTPPQPPAGGGGGGGGKPPTPPPAPPGPVQPQLDSTAQANIAAYNFKANNSINNDVLKGNYLGTQLQAALAQLDYNQPRQSLQLEQAANRRGALYSSVYGQQLGDMNYKYAGQRGGLESKYASDMAGLANDIAGLQGGETTYAGQQAAGSASRASQQAARNPAAGTTGPGKGKGSSSGSGSGSGAGKGKGGRGLPSLASQNSVHMRTRAALRNVPSNKATTKALKVAGKGKGSQQLPKPKPILPHGLIAG